MAKFCTNCGEKLEEGMRFCTNCGAPVEDASSKAETVLLESELETDGASAPVSAPAEVPQATPTVAPSEAPENEKADALINKAISQKTAKKSGLIIEDHGLTCALYLFFVLVFPYLCNCFLIKSSHKSLSPMTVVFTEVAGWVLATIALFVCTTFFTKEGSKRILSNIGRTLAISAIFAGGRVLGDYAVGRFATGFDDTSMYIGLATVPVAFVACIIVISMFVKLDTADTVRPSFVKNVLAGFVLLLAFFSPIIIDVILACVPFEVEVSFLSNCSYLMASVLIQSLLFSLAVKCARRKAKEKEQPKDRLALVPLVLGALIFVAAFVVRVNQIPKISAAQMCKDDINLYRAKEQVLMNIGDIPGALDVLDDICNHANAWEMVACEESLSYEYKYMGDTVMLLYLLSNPDKTETFAATLTNDAENSLWYPFLLDYFSDKKSSGKNGDLRTEAENSCIAYMSFVNSFPTLKEIEKDSKKILKVTEEAKTANENTELFELALDTAAGKMSVETNIYKMLDIAEKNPDATLIQLATIYNGISLLKDNAGYYSRVADAITRLDEQFDKEKLSKENTALYKETFGDMYASMKYYEQAEQCYLAAVDKGADETVIGPKLADVANRAGDAEKVELYVKKLVEAGTDDTQTIYLYFISCLKKGEHETALEMAKKLSSKVKSGYDNENFEMDDLYLFNCIEYLAIRDDGYWTDFTHNIYSKNMSEELAALFAEDPFLDKYAKTLYLVKEERDYEEAEVLAQELTKQYPMSSQLWYLQGLAFADDQKFEEAVAAFRKSLELVPFQPNTKFALANCLDALEQYEEAYELTKQVEAEIGTEVDHEADIYGLGYHNPRLKNALARKVEEEAAKND